MSGERFVSGKDAADILGISQQSLRKFAGDGSIDVIKTPGGQRRYNVASFVKSQHPDTKKKTKKKIIYCRVSSNGQKCHLEHQIRFLRDRFPEHELVTDVASGLNWKRPGLKRILEQAMHGTVEEVVVAHRDRVARFGVELVEWILQRNGARLLVLDERVGSKEEELVTDLISVVHVFSARAYGARSYSRKRKENDDVKEEREGEGEEEQTNQTK
jgi:predicted site-specific integrase-resolvase